MKTLVRNKFTYKPLENIKEKQWRALGKDKESPLIQRSLSR